MSTLSEDRVNRLWDVLADAGDGLTMVELVDKCELNEHTVKVALRDLRDLLAEDEVNVVCEPQTGHRPHIYKLVGRYEDAKPWATARINDMVRRVRTIQNVATSIAHHEGGRSYDGRRARVLERKMRQTLEELAELGEDLAG